LDCFLSAGRFLVEFVNMRTLKARLSEYVNSLDERGPVLITCHGDPKAVLFPFKCRELNHLIRLDEKSLAEAIVSHTVEMHERLSRQRRTWRPDRKGKG
jgi:prevent-host-death family protein